MCRWMVYSGTPLLARDLLYTTENSLVVQSMRSQLGAEPTNGDGFGLGWYLDGGEPGVFKSTEPAWNDRNLRELSGAIRSDMLFAHVRASTGSPIQQTNCHPFRHGRWLWMHNGSIAGFKKVHRELVLSVDPDLFPDIEGTTDSEVFFNLALTFGLEDDPPTAVARAAGRIEEAGRRHGEPFPLQMTVATTDGDTLWAFRYSSEGRSRSLFRSEDVTTLREQYPDNPVLTRLAADSRLVVSEPLGGLKGAWREVPDSSCIVVRRDGEEVIPWAPSVEEVTPVGA